VGEVKYLSLDPGNSTGWATFRENGSAIEFGTVKGKVNFYDLLSNMQTSEPEWTHIICENYKLYPWKSTEQAWSQLDTVRIIGALEMFAHDHLLDLTFQDPSVKTIAYKWAGLAVPKQKAQTHETDAYVHGIYYLQKAGIRTPQQGRLMK